MYIGVDYYPEHWPRERWKTDAQAMHKAGFNVVRLAEFSWVNMEPVEGQYEFGWLDDAIQLLGKQGISVILGTPTAVMPAWMARKYPECLATNRDGRREVWGVRKNNCFTSATYCLFSERITRAMAAHFAKTPTLIGWQTDNEFGGPYCYCHSCRHAFQDYLREKYAGLEELNRAWGTHFWGHRYLRWDEIPIPVDFSTHNPSACLDWQRFASDMNVRFQHAQVVILRELCPRHFITHNLMGLYKQINYFDLARELDFVSWDNYPVWGRPDIRYSASLAADLMRGLKSKNFWIMEQTAGSGGWSEAGRNPYPGEIRSVAYQQLAHGADGQIWFRWRTCTAGREQYWHGLLQHDGKLNRRYKEAAQVAQEYHQLAQHLEGTTVRPSVAIVYDYDSMWATDIQKLFPGNDYPTTVARYYNALFRAGTNVDVVPTSADLSKYKLVLAPNLHILPDDIAHKLSAFVKNGGVLFTDCRTGVKDATSLCYDRVLPGLLAPALGLEIPEYDCLATDMKFPLIGKEFTGDFSAVHYTDWIRPTTAETLATYDAWHLKDYSALTRNAFGKGSAYYLGTLVSQPEFYDRLISLLLESARIKPLIVPPAGVEVSVRQRGAKKIVFLINHTEELQTVELPASKLELLQNQKIKSLDLPRHGVAVVRW